MDVACLLYTSERFSAIVLILAIAGIGLAPLWISDMIRESLNGLWPFSDIVNRKIIKYGIF